jgi:hypothetical protein
MANGQGVVYIRLYSSGVPVCLSVYPFVCLFVCLSIYLFIIFIYKFAYLFLFIFLFVQTVFI